MLLRKEKQKKYLGEGSKGENVSYKKCWGITIFQPQERSISYAQ